MRKLDSNAETVAIEKGIIKEGEEFSDVLRRVARNLAQCEQPDKKKLWEDRFFNIMDKNYFLPNYPTLRNGAREDGKITATLSACFVLGIEDSRDSIFQTLKDAAEIQAAGGGTGFNFSKLRARGTRISSTGGVSSGPVSFMNIYDVALGDTIKQGGMRHGANMGGLSVYHPDIEEFIKVKSDHDKLTNFNLSVIIDDAFIEKAKNGENIQLIDPHTKQVVKELNATILLKEIATHAHAHGCPGVLFVDNANANNPFDIPLTATNPCGETWLYPMEACTIGALNYKQIDQDELSEDELYNTIEASVRLLDNIIELNHYPLPGMKEIAKKYRKIGIGAMGIADVLFMRKLGYATKEGRDFVDKIFGTMQAMCVKASEELAQERGAFEAFAESKFTVPRRNSYITLQQPTGTLSILASCSAAIEPIFSCIQFVTTSKGKSKLKIVNPIIQSVLKRRKLWDKELEEQIYKNNGSLQNIKSIPDDLKEVFVTALDVSFEDHIRMQALVQRHMDNSVSKTINMRNDAKVEDIEKSIILAHALGCKGLTVYIDGSKDNQPIESSLKSKEKIVEIVSRSRSKVMIGQTEKIDLGQCGSILSTINVENGKIREVLLNKGHSGGCARAMTEAIGRLMSVALKYGTPVDEVIKEVVSIKCDNQCYDCAEGEEKPDKISSCPNAVGVALRRCMKRQNLGEIKLSGNLSICPKCGERSVVTEGSCEYCSAGCGYSKC